MIAVRGLRGATTVEADRAELIDDAVRELLTELLDRNGLTAAEVVSAWFTSTADLTSEFPAHGARRHLGWEEVPMLCAQELEVDGALERCVRVLLHVEVARGTVLRPVYLRDAVTLRPDRAAAEQVTASRVRTLPSTLPSAPRAPARRGTGP
jgi:monofunctional chorismate mutase